MPIIEPFDLPARLDRWAAELGKTRPLTREVIYGVWKLEDAAAEIRRCHHEIGCLRERVAEMKERIAQRGPQATSDAAKPRPPGTPDVIRLMRAIVAALKAGGCAVDLNDPGELDVMTEAVYLIANQYAEPPTHAHR